MNRYTMCKSYNRIKTSGIINMITTSAIAFPISLISHIPYDLSDDACDASLITPLKSYSTCVGLMYHVARGHSRLSRQLQPRLLDIAIDRAIDRWGPDTGSNCVEMDRYVQSQLYHKF